MADGAGWARDLARVESPRCGKSAGRQDRSSQRLDSSLEIRIEMPGSADEFLGEHVEGLHDHLPLLDILKIQGVEPSGDGRFVHRPIPIDDLGPARWR